MSALLTFATKYHELGLNITHIVPQRKSNDNGEYEYTFKAPSHEFESLEFKRQEFSELLSYNWDEAVGVGAVMGYNNTRSIDIDGCNDITFIRELLEAFKLPQDYEWVVKTGSGNGFQIIVNSGEHGYSIPKGTILSLFPKEQYDGVFHHLELRWKNHIVLPPSKHVSGRNYEFISGKLPTNPPLEVFSGRVTQVLQKRICKFQSETNPTGSFYLNFISDEYAFLETILSAGYTYKTLYREPFYLFIDTETNGLPPNEIDPSTNPNDFPDVFQISVLACDSFGRRIDAKSIYLIPDGWDLKDEVKEILSIDESQLLSNGSYVRDYEPDDEEYRNYSYRGRRNNPHILKEVFGLLRKREFEVSTIVGHNLKYDINCLFAQYYRARENELFQTFANDLKEILESILPSLNRICTMESTTEFCELQSSFRFKYPKLQELHYSLFDKEFEGAHNADMDVYNTAKCYWKLRDLGEIE